MLLENVKKRCEEQGVTFYALEKKLNFSGGSISKWGDSMPAANKLKAVANELGCTVDDLLEDQEEQ